MPAKNEACPSGSTTLPPTCTILHFGGRVVEPEGHRSEDTPLNSTHHIIPYPPLLLQKKPHTPAHLTSHCRTVLLVPHPPDHYVAAHHRWRHASGRAAGRGCTDTGLPPPFPAPPPRDEPAAGGDKGRSTGGPPLPRPA